MLSMSRSCRGTVCNRLVVTAQLGMMTAKELDSALGGCLGRYTAVVLHYIDSKIYLVFIYKLENNSILGVSETWLTYSSNKNIFWDGKLKKRCYFFAFNLPTSLSV